MKSCSPNFTKNEIHLSTFFIVKREDILVLPHLTHASESCANSPIIEHYHVIVRIDIDPRESRHFLVKITAGCKATEPGIKFGSETSRIRIGSHHRTQQLIHQLRRVLSGIVSQTTPVGTDKSFNSIGWTGLTRSSFDKFSCKLLRFAHDIINMSSPSCIPTGPFSKAHCLDVVVWVRLTVEEFAKGSIAHVTQFFSGFRSE
mmetsp:Transcript_105/g.154  ORF Transcript_105/g.154 Transcript_105/m.154 type:complete len:202 (+) Transcript_105:239-844(+)